MSFWRRLALAAACVLALVSPAAAAKRVALVIGNAAYANAPALANPANDASDVAEKLKELGFEVIVGLNTDKRAFDSKLREFSTALESADAAILFYAGHGLQIAGRNYLVPTDAKLERERDVEFEAVSLDFILKQMELERASQTNIVFLDACRNNPLARNLSRTMGTRAVSIGSGLAETVAGVGTFISYSTQPGNVALDGNGRNSPFAEALVKRIREQGKSLTSLMIDVRRDVVSATDGKQVPWDHSALTGEFFFDPSAKREDNAALQGEVEALKKQLADKASQGASAAAATTLVMLRQRVAQMKDETRRDWDHVFELQRSEAGSGNDRKRMEVFQEIGRLQIGIVKRGKDKAELETEIAKLEKETGSVTEAPGAQTPGTKSPETPARALAPPGDGKEVGQEAPTTGATASISPTVKPVERAEQKSAKSAPKARKPVAQHKRSTKAEPALGVRPFWE